MQELKLGPLLNITSDITSHGDLLLVRAIVEKNSVEKFHFNDAIGIVVFLLSI